MNDGEGRISLIGTPIGNLGDLTPRAASALAAADVIFCEDTRRTRKLLSAAGIPAPRLVSLHRHNESESSAKALSMAQDGSVVAVVTDAGMPGISDPGELIVRMARDAGVPVEVVPGPAAFVVALVASGLPGERFCFEGFLPRRGPERAARLAAIAAETRTCVLYEAPHRAARTLADLAGACGAGRPVAVARELTKLHEEIFRGTAGEAAAWAGEGEPRGEWVIVVAPGPAEHEEVSDDAIRRELQDRLDGGATRRDAVDDVAAALGVPRRRVYQLAVG